MLYVAAPIMKAGEIFGVVTVGKPQDSVSFFIDIARDRLRLTLLLIGASAVGIAVLMSFWVTWPLKRLTRYVRSVREGRPEPLPALGSPEIRLLGESIGEMQSRLEGKNYIEDYIRALTHEMKSPLTGIRGAAEILRDLSDDGRSLRFIDNIDSESRRMQDLVERMLQLSRLENVRSITRQGIEAGLFFHELAGSLQARLDEKSQTLRLAVQESLLLQADPFLLRLAVNNLLVNAMDFAPSGSTITLTASGCPEHGEERVFRHGAEISVRDEGPGIPDFALPKVFDKFFSLARPDTGKKSSGLGLPFVREVAALHGGRVLLSNRSPGLEARLLLPGA